MRTILLFSIMVYSFFGFAQDGKPLKVGEEINRVIESVHPYKGSTSRTHELVWSQKISEDNASYIAVHFQKLELAPDDYLIIRNSQNTRAWKYSFGQESRTQFWSIHIYGDEAIIEIFSKSSSGSYGYKIDKIAKGYAQGEIAYKTTEQEALCGPDDTQEAVCYQNSEPFVYDKSRAVARLLINGTSACTGWLIGDDGHLMTNEHCVSNASQANNVTVEFMAEGNNCSTDCRTWFGCGGTIVATSTTLVKVNSNLDYALLQLPTNVSATYGFLQLREVGAAQGERIYIPQHPQAWGKRIALESTDPHDTGGVARVYSVNSQRCNGTGNDIGYYADTQPGSSGSPVIGYNDNLVVALHHCGSCPNRGVPIQEIIADLGDDLPNNSLPLPPEIIGPQTICYSINGTTYSLQNGESNGWNVSSNLEILSSSNTSITVKPTNSSTIGAGFIEAILPLETIREDIWIGAHKPNGFVSVIVDPWLGRIKARVEPVQDATGYIWYLDGVQYTGPGMNSDYVTMPIPRNNCTIPDYSIGVRAINPCGTSVGHFELHENPCYEGEYYYSYSPNPASETLTVERVNQSDSKSNNKTISTVHQYRLHDFNGNLVQEGNLSAKTEIDVSKLPDGRYILIIQIDKNNRETHHIIIK